MTLLFIYTFIDNVVERPDGVIISSVFIAGILIFSGFSRYQRARELRVSEMTFVDSDSADFEIALGIKECTYCHVKGDFASDENPVKDTARRMIRQLHVINALSPDGEKHVNCWTCHRGSHGSKPDYPAGTDPELAP